MYSWFWLIGSPFSRSPRPTPSRSGISRLPSVVHQVHVARQRGSLALAPVLERHAPRDQRGEHQQQRQVEGREHRRVPVREGRERARAGHDQPHLVPVPERADRVDRHAPLGLRPADDRVQHADAEIESLEHEEPDPQDRQQDEPERVKRHQRPLVGQRRDRGAPGSRWSSAGSSSVSSSSLRA